MLVQQSSAGYPLLFLMVDSTDHVTGKTGLTPTVTISKAGAAFASPAGAVTEIANGWYKVAGNATDTNTFGPIALHATGTAADPTDRDIWEVVAFNPQDATALGLSRIDATITSRMASYTQPTGFLAATFPAGTIANTTNITAGTVTTVTNLTNAPTAGDFTATMKTSIGTAVAASAVASVAGNVGGNVIGSVGSVTGLTVSNLDATISSRLSTAGYTAPDNTSITAIKAKTDSLTFTVAFQLDSNIQYVNDTQINGAGTAGNPWGP